MAVEIKAATYAALRTALAAGTYQAGQMVFCEGRAAAGDGGQGMGQVVAIGSLTDDGGVTLTGGSFAWVRTRQSPALVSVEWWGRDTASITAACAALTDYGALYFPGGAAYTYERGTGSLITDNIEASNVLIYGDGPATVINGLKGDGTVPNDAGNEYYCLFQATGQSGITIRDLQTSGYLTLASLFGCSDIIISGITDNALLDNASNHLRNKSVYLYKCTGVAIENNTFKNFGFAIYLSGDGTQKTEDVRISGNSFRHGVAAGEYTSQFPCGVYAYYAAGVVVTGNSFANIYSSVDAGTTGTGMGYGVYEGDGAAGAISVVGNTFNYQAKGTKRAIGVYATRATALIVGENAFDVGDDAQISSLVRRDQLVDDATTSIANNQINVGSDFSSCFPVYLAGSSNTNTGVINVTGNNIIGGANGVRQDGLPSVTLRIQGNSFQDQIAEGVRISGLSTSYPVRDVELVGNEITRSGTNGVLFGQYVVSPTIKNNRIVDGNTTEVAGDSGAAILFSSYSFGSVIVGNTIGNRLGSDGHFTYGVQNASNANSRIFKDVLAQNNFVGLNNNTQYGRYWTASPTNGIVDASKGDFVLNVQADASDPPGWHCVVALAIDLSSDASSASTTLNVSSTSGISAGDILVLTKSKDPASSNYATNADHHVTTVASVTDGTNLVITDAIPGGDGTYTTGTAGVWVARYKAAATLAA